MSDLYYWFLIVPAVLVANMIWAGITVLACKTKWMKNYIMKKIVKMTETEVNEE